MSLTRAAGAALGSLAMQVPYAASANPDDVGLVGRVLSKTVPLDVETEWDGYSQHWWWDNAAHLLGGYAVGHVLARFLGSRERVLKAFLILTGGLEAVEYASGERPWHTNGDGEMAWNWDHRMEDTALDTVMGAAGAYLAATEYYGYDLLDG